MSSVIDCICTVLLITYNHEPYIRTAIESVLNQKTKYIYKIYIFDDASTDGTSDIVREYSDKYPNLIRAFIAKENQGAEINILNAYKSVDTEYCAVLECDDFWNDEEKLELQIDAMEEHPECSFSAHNTFVRTLSEKSREYQDNSLWISRSIFKLKKIISYKDIEPIDIGGYIPHISSRLVRSKLLDIDLIKYKQSILFDFNQYFYLLLKGPYYYIDRVMSVYQKTGSGIHSGKKPLAVLNQEYPWIVDFNKETNLVIAEKIFREYKLQTEHRLNLYFKDKKEYDIDNSIDYIREIKILEEKIKTLENISNNGIQAFEDSRASLSFRIGRFVTFFPRKIRAIYRYCKVHGFLCMCSHIKQVLSRPFMKKNDILNGNKSDNQEGNKMDIKYLVFDKNKYYFLCNAGIGDTLLVSALRMELEKKYKGCIHLLIDITHEFLMEMFACTEYTLVDFKNTNLEMLSSENPLPKKGGIFVAHPNVHKELWNFFQPIYEHLSTVKFYPWFLEFLGLDKSVSLMQPTTVPKISEEFKQRCETIAPIDKIVLIVPEAKSMHNLPLDFWIRKVQEIKRDGYIVVTNVIDPGRNIPGSIYLNMTLKEAVSLGYACHAVYALRNGFCDALFLKGKDLHVYYPFHCSLFIYSLRDLFGRHDIDEEIILLK